MNTIEWLQKWYSNNCYGDWEHQYGIEIKTIDNPGWDVTVDLIYTAFQDLEIEMTNYNISESNWYCFKVTDGKFNGFGDPTKLETIILKFKEIVENH
jgi:hypothetical protein